jgi:heterodisulfide reductase subunit A
LLTLSEVLDVRGEPGNLQADILQHPRYVDLEKCIGCGTCAEKCPKKVEDDYNEGLIKRKAIYVPYAQAVPLKYAIDKDNCIFFEKGKCKACEKFCSSGAVKFDDQEKRTTVQVGAIILAPGFQPFDPSKYDTYNYAKLPNVITSMEFEGSFSFRSHHGPSGLACPITRSPRRSHGSSASVPEICTGVTIPTALPSVACMPSKKPSSPRSIRERIWTAPSSSWT